MFGVFCLFVDFLFVVWGLFVDFGGFCFFFFVPLAGRLFLSHALALVLVLSDPGLV